MKHEPLQRTRFFFVTTPLPCPYFPDRLERRVVTELTGREAGRFHDLLSLAGFRRSHGVAYVPACPGCSACIPVRIVADRFAMSRTWRRVHNANADVTAAFMSATATDEQFSLFASYQKTRHGDGDMNRMDMADYRALIEDTPINTRVAEFRDADGRLIAACLTDLLEDGLSAVYSFFDPDPALDRHSLGSYMILWLVEQARSIGLPYVYLGFWIKDCRKMSYKSRFRPVEHLTPEGWRLLGPDSPSL
ncbi:MAG: arginyltransferase [Magnetospirillum sp. WYHS-4]